MGMIWLLMLELFNKLISYSSYKVYHIPKFNPGQIEKKKWTGINIGFSRIPGKCVEIHSRNVKVKFRLKPYPPPIQVKLNQIISYYLFLFILTGKRAILSYIFCSLGHNQRLNWMVVIVYTQLNIIESIYWYLKMY